MTSLPNGIYSPVTTFFKDDYTLDIDSQIEHAKFLYKNGINGLLLAGSLGEANHLSRQERSILVSSVRAAIPDLNFKIIAGVPPIGNIPTAIEDCVSAKEAGADFVILLVPGFFGPILTFQEGIIDYFQRVADDSPLPVIIYNYPGTCNGVTVTYESFKKLSKHPKIAGVKLTHFNLDMYTLLGQDKEMRDVDNFKPFTGLGQVLIPALAVGVHGAIDGLSAIFPKVMVNLFTLFHLGKISEAAALQALAAEADLMIAELNVVGVKRALKDIHGLGGENLTGRPPLSRPLDLDSYNKYADIMEKLNILESSL